MEILPQLLVNAAIAGSIYALASSGLALIYGLLGILNFAHGHLMMLGAYLFYFASVQLGYGLAAASLVTLGLTIIFSAVLFRIFVLPFTRFNVMLTLVTTLALSNILEALVSIAFGVQVKSLSSGLAIQSIEIGSVYITPIQILILSSALIMLSLLAFVIHSTSVGRAIRALSEYPQAAESIAISQRKMSYGVFVLGAIFAGYAGILVGLETNMQPTMGTAYTIKAFAAMILGGLGNVWGAIIGSYILGLVENLSIGLDFGGYSIPAGYKDAFAFAIILLTLLIRPRGIFGSRKRMA